MGSYTFGHLKKFDNQGSNYFITFTKRKKKKRTGGKSHTEISCNHNKPV